MADTETRPRASDGTIPAPPQGYGTPYPLQQSWAVLSIGGTLLGLAALFTGLGLSPAFPAGPTAGRIAPGTAWLLFLGGIGGTVVGHELVHGLAYRYYGYDVSFTADLLNGTFTTAARGQLHTRAEAIRIALMPLLTVTPVALVLVVAPSLELSLLGVVVLTVNVAGSVSDLLLIWRLRSLPARSLLCDGDATYVYEPADKLRGQK